MDHFNALVGGLFILTVFALIYVRQVIGCVKLFIFQSILLAISASIIAYSEASVHLYMVSAITFITKAIFIPGLLYSLLSDDIHAKREIDHVFNIPTSLLIGAALTLFAYFTVKPLLDIDSNPFIKIDVPIGMAGLLMGAYAITVRREALPQLIGILTMENSAFLCAISIAPNLSLISELAAAFDVFIIALVMGILTKKIHIHVGSTLVGKMTNLKEE